MKMNENIENKKSMQKIKKKKLSPVYWKGRIATRITIDIQRATRSSTSSFGQSSHIRKLFYTQVPINYKEAVKI